MTRRAVLDVGSNSILLLVAAASGDQWQTVHEETRVTGLGTGTKTTGLLQPEPMAESLAALREFFSKAHELGAERIVAGGTMALRIANNSGDFLAAAEAQSTPVRVLSGTEEAELGFLAVADDPAFREHDRISIIDPGGHSTELVTADRTWHQPAGAPYALSSWDIRFRRSYPVGALGLRETLLHAESPDFSARLKAVAAIDDEIGLCYLPNQSGHSIVLGATGVNLINIRNGWTDWRPSEIHASYLDYEEVGRAVGWMFDLDDAGRAAIVGIEKGREKTLHIGALILERFLQSLRTLGTSVSVRGWRHALLERLNEPAWR